MVKQAQNIRKTPKKGFRGGLAWSTLLRTPGRWPKERSWWPKGRPWWPKERSWWPKGRPWWPKGRPWWPMGRMKGWLAWSRWGEALSCPQGLGLNGPIGPFKPSYIIRKDQYSCTGDMLGYWWYSVGAPLATAPVSPCLKIRPEIRGSHGEKLKLWFLKTINYVSRQCTEEQSPHPRGPVNVTFKCENPELNGWESGIVKFVWKYEDTSADTLRYTL